MTEPTVTFQLEHRGQLTVPANRAADASAMGMEEAALLGLLSVPQVVSQPVVRDAYTRDEPVIGGTQP